MAMKDYSDEFKADAVALYESTPGATYKAPAGYDVVNRTQQDGPKWPHFVKTTRRVTGPWE
ncbi:transposase [Streptomyces galilaeus]|uniref:transposase n=1 Tax=Streptomyces galilaeus TaxID=33899 RepID=UPI00167400BB|nr:transposase [Streptomyces galilaeus]GGW82432.1 hypothetical protein GCM10010350_79070 [Streptomyces galilaeus]